MNLLKTFFYLATSLIPVVGVLLLGGGERLFASAEGRAIFFLSLIVGVMLPKALSGRSGGG